MGINEYNRLGGIPPDPEYHVSEGDYEHARMVEEHADNLMDKCRDFKFSEALSSKHDLYDGDLLPKLMVEIASWRGRPMNSHDQMKKLHNLFADTLQIVAERECRE